MKKVLHVFGKMDCGGAETRTMDIFRNINREKVQFDFLTMKPGEGFYDSEIRGLGGQIFVISPPSTSNVFKHIKEIIEVIKKNGPYDAVHAHTSYHTGIVSLAAFIAGVKIRISHSRSASNRSTKGLFRKAYFKLMRILINIFTTEKVACGTKAGSFLYGPKAIKKGEVRIIKNAIDFGAFNNLIHKSPELRRNLGISENELLIGHVGSFTPVKNHEFLIKVAKKLQSKNVSFKMIFVGDGKLKKEIENKVKEAGLNDIILFLGIRSDIPQIMSFIDILLLPSLYEGIPGVVIEAQAVGTSCIISDKVTKEVDSDLNLIKFLPINDANIWAKAIMESDHKEKIDKNIIYEKLSANEFTVERSIEKFYKIYKIY